MSERESHPIRENSPLVYPSGGTPEESQSFFQATLNSLTSHVAVLDENGTILMINKAWASFASANGLTWRNDGIGVNYLEVCRPVANQEREDVEHVRCGIKEVLEGDAMLFSHEYPCHSPREQRWFLMHVTPFRGGGRAKAVVAHENITRRRLAEDQTKLLMGELDHRVKNICVVIEAVATETIRHSRNLDDFADSYLSRLRSIAQAASLLSRHHWKDASFRKILITEIEPFCRDDTGCLLDGPDLLLSADQTLSMQMVIHELATNACKYGGLKPGGGGVEISWSLSPDPSPTMELEWRERVSEPVPPPERAGYGTHLIKQLVEYEFEGKLEQQFRPEGLHVHLKAKLK